MEAAEEKYGVREEAYAVLRSIDNEEFNQKMLEERRKFSYVQSAYNRRDYVNARALLDNIDTKLLNDQQTQRLKEILQTPQMQPTHDSRVVQAQ